MKNEKSKDVVNRQKRSEAKKNVPFSVSMLRKIFNAIGPLFPTFAAQKALQIFMTPRRKEVLLPPIFKQAYIIGTPFKNTRIRSYMWGQTGKIVLLVHGWESGAWIFNFFISALLRSGYRVVAIEGPAHADSSQKQTNMIDFGDALYAVIQRLENCGGVHAIIGHSFGGSTLINMFYRKSKPVSIKKVVLIAIPARVDRVFYGFFKYLQLPAKVSEAFKYLMKQRFGLRIEDLKVGNWVTKLNINKVLIIHDKNDKVISYKEAEELAASWKTSQLLITQGLGHNRVLKSADVLEDILSYFEEAAPLKDQDVELAKETLKV